MFEYYHRKDFLLAGHRAAIFSLAYLERLNTLISGDQDGSLFFWVLCGDTIKVNSIKAHSARLSSIITLSETAQFLTGSKDGLVKIWQQSETSEEIGSFSKKQPDETHEKAVYSLANLGNGKVLSHTEDCQYNVWDLDHLGCIYSFDRASEHSSNILSPEGASFFIGPTQSNGIGVWDYRERNMVKEYEGQSFDCYISSLSMINGNDHLLSSGDNDGSVKLWDLRNSDCLMSITGHSSRVNALGTLGEYELISASKDGSIKIWDVKDGTCEMVIPDAHTSEINTIHCQENSAKKSVFSGSEDKRIGLWDVNNVRDAAEKTAGGTNKLVEPVFHEPLPDNEIKTIKLPYSFIFEGSESKSKALKCTIFSNDHSLIQNSLINNIFDFLAANNVARENDDIEILIKKDKCVVFFKALATKALAIEPVIKFINWLSELGFMEIYQNPTALWFYAHNGGGEILNFTNYPPLLRIFLEQERFSLDALLEKNNQKYTTLVEVGCGAMENLALAHMNNLSYYGIDFSASCILQAQQRIKDDNIKQAKAQCLSIVSFERSDLLLDINEKPVFFFPFNLLGNIAPLSKLLARFKSFGFDMLFSIYKTDDKTNEIRLNYYSNCGYNHIQKEHHEYGVVFKSEEGLYTIAYDKNYLNKLLKSFGFHVVVTESIYGFVFYASAIPLELKLVSSFSSDDTIESENIIRTASPTGEELYNAGIDAQTSGHGDEALSFFKRASLKSFAKSYTSLGLFKVQEGSDKKMGIAYLEMAAHNGHARAMFNLGRIYEKGDTEDGYCDYSKALVWYKKAYAIDPSESYANKIKFLEQLLASTQESGYQIDSCSSAP